MKDYLKAARDAERRKAWDEATYFATMAALSTDVIINATKVNVDADMLKSAMDNMKPTAKAVTPPSKLHSSTPVFNTNSAVQSHRIVRLDEGAYVLGLDPDGEAYLYRCS